MRFISSSKDLCCFCLTRNLLLFCIRSQKCSTIKLSEKGKSGESSTNSIESEGFLGCIVSSCSKYIAAITSSKKLIVWFNKAKDHLNQEWTPLKTWVLVKRPVDVLFDTKLENVLVADKTGDVLRFTLPTADAQHSVEIVKLNTDDIYHTYSQNILLLGHLSMLLTMNMSECGKYIITGDRDEKIRVSHYPLAYDVQSFCLSHTEFISKVETLPSSPDLLLSASGDGKIMLWRLQNGSLVHSVDTSEYSSNYLCKKIDAQEALAEESVQEVAQSDPFAGRERVVPQQSAVISLAVTKGSDSDIIAVSFDGSKCIALFEIKNSQIVHICDVETKSVASAVRWLDECTLVATFSADKDMEVKGSLNVFKYSDSSLHSIEDHPLVSFAESHSDETNDFLVADTTILYKERYDNVAEYKKKKQQRIEMVEQKRQSQNSTNIVAIKKIKLQ